MVNQQVVEIIAKRIMSGGNNPLTGKVYVIEDITNEAYKKAVLAYIKQNSK